MEICSNMLEIISFLYSLKPIFIAKVKDHKYPSYMKTRFSQKPKMVSGKANPLVQRFSHLLEGFKRPLINEFTPLEYLLI